MFRREFIGKLAITSYYLVASPSAASGQAALLCKLRSQSYPAIKSGCRSVRLAEYLIKYAPKYETWYIESKIEISLKKPISRPPPVPELQGGMDKLLKATAEIFGDKAALPLFKIERRRLEDIILGSSAVEVANVVSTVREIQSQIEISLELVGSYRALAKNIVSAIKKLKFVRNGLTGYPFKPYGARAWQIHKVLLPELQRIRNFLEKLIDLQIVEGNEALVNLKAIRSKAEIGYRNAISNLDQALLQFDSEREKARSKLVSLNQKAKDLKNTLEKHDIELRRLRNRETELRKRLANANDELAYAKSRSSKFLKDYRAKLKFVRSKSYDCGGNAGHKDPFQKNENGYVCNMSKSKNYRTAANRLNREHRRWRKKADTHDEAVQRHRTEISRTVDRISEERMAKTKLDEAMRQLGRDAREQFELVSPSVNEKTAIIERTKFGHALRSIELVGI